jgi:hypothetical protein
VPVPDAPQNQKESNRRTKGSAEGWTGQKDVRVMPGARLQRYSHAISFHIPIAAQITQYLGTAKTCAGHIGRSGTSYATIRIEHGN